jgi:hypothetical protein
VRRLHDVVVDADDLRQLHGDPRSGSADDVSVRYSQRSDPPSTG